MTQSAQVLELLKARGPQGVTALDALDQVGTFRLAAHVHTLRAEGWPITTRMVDTPEGAHIARYILERAYIQAPMPWADE